MMTTANVAQLKARLSEYLRQAKGGSEIVVTERGVPVARLAPLEPEQRRATRLDRLMRAGVVRAPRSKLPKAFFRHRRALPRWCCGGARQSNASPPSFASIVTAPSHAIRAADAPHLAAALVWCEEQPSGEVFVSLDDRLRDAARREGFTILPA